MKAALWFTPTILAVVAVVIASLNTESAANGLVHQYPFWSLLIFVCVVAVVAAAPPTKRFYQHDFISGRTISYVDVPTGERPLSETNPGCVTALFVVALIAWAVLYFVW